MTQPDQFKIFLLCMAIGLCGGALYDLFSLPRRLFPVRWVHISCDICFCIAFGALYLIFFLWLRLPAFRLFYLFACIIGIVLYRKSVREILAFFFRKVYNRIKSLRKEKPTWKTRKKLRAAKR